MACHTEQQPIPIKEISEKLNISFHFLTKILQKITKQNLMRSYKGARGGVALAKSANSITLMDIILAIEEQDFFQKCLLGLDECSDESPCPAHNQWAPIRKEFRSLSEGMSLAILADKIKKDGYRIASFAKK